MRQNRADSQIRIERAAREREKDAQALIQEYYEAVEVVVRDDPEALRRYFNGENGGVWIAYIDERPAGCVLLRPLPHPDAAGEIKRLYVRPEYRRAGIASLLMDQLEAFAIQHGMKWLYLDTKDDLKDAIAFYERHGYSRCARYNDNPQATIFMRKRLYRTNLQSPK
jgi:GNAT superfamily N-acetyltransferase